MVGGRVTADAAGAQSAGDGKEKRNGGAPVRVFVVDDHAIIREAVRLVLAGTDDLLLVGEASTVPEAERGIAATAPQVAVVDARLGADDGIDLVGRIRAVRPDVRCVVFTSFPGRDSLFRAVTAGAGGYVSKEFSSGQLVSAIRRVAGGRSVLCWNDVDDPLPEDVAPAARAHDPMEDLTAQEQRILAFVSEGWTNREIALRLKLAEKTVRNYVSNILGKLGLRNRTEAATYVLARSRDRVLRTSA